MYLASITWQGEPECLITTKVGLYSTHDEAYNFACVHDISLKLLGKYAYLFYNGELYRPLRDDEIIVEKQKPETYDRESLDESDYEKVSVPMKDWHNTDGLNTGFESLAYSIQNTDTGQYEN